MVAKSPRSHIEGDSSSPDEVRPHDSAVHDMPNREAVSSSGAGPDPEDDQLECDPSEAAITEFSVDLSGLEVKSLTAVEFADLARLIAEVALMGGLRAPGFASPPRRPEVDRSIRRQGANSVVAVRRRGRPAAAVQADLIEGVVVANELDEFDAARFRSQAWAAVTVGRTTVVQQVVELGDAGTSENPATSDDAESVDQERSVAETCSSAAQDAAVATIIPIGGAAEAA